MKDPRIALLKQLKIVLDPIGLPVYSYVPSNHKELFIFIGEIQTGELPNKSQFLIGGQYTIELYTGTNEWLDSIKEPLNYFNAIKEAIQPNKGDILDLSPNFSMIFQTLSSDAGIQQYSNMERLYVGTLQYEFQIGQI